MRQTALYRKVNSLSYAEYGDSQGYPVLIQHGMVASIDDGYLFQRLIQSGRYLICIARPGYGASSPYPMANIAEWAAIAAVVIDQLGLSQFDLLGMSSGAPYTYSIAHHFPRRVRSVYIFSGIPALYDEGILSHWPYPVDKNADIAELQKLAHELFFPNVSEEDLKQNAVRDSMMNNCFGIAQDLRLRCRDWGFDLSEVNARVYMQHSRGDAGVPLVTAELTARLLPHCALTIKDTDIHFSPEALDEFIEAAMLL